MAKKRKGKYFYVFKSAITGFWCTKAYAEKHPDTTIRYRRLRQPG